MNYPNFKVCCRCFTFNQSMYITDTMNGFIMQQTSFPFVCTIVDDASTDGEQEVIRKYVDENFDFSEGSVAFNKETDYAFITFAQHKTNKNCYFAVLYLKENHYSKGMGKQKMSYLAEWRDNVKYDALCEGDDYWEDSQKLKKQIHILENNPDCSIVLSNGYVLSPSGRKGLINPLGAGVESSFISIEEMLIEKNAMFPTASMVARNEILKRMPDFFKQCPVGDKPYRTWMALNGKVYYFDEAMVVYRAGAISSFSLWSGRKNGYAKRLYDGMHTYYRELNNHTGGRMLSLIEYLDEKEKFFYYKRINNIYGMTRCPYFKNMTKEKQKAEIKELVFSYMRHKGRQLLTLLHLNWLYPKRF